ncbi:collagen binding domain-containing protein [Holzapfeliella sp. JNUCC 72]
MKNKLFNIINILIITVMALGYVIPLTQVNVSAETTETADVKITPESYSASRNGQTLDFNSSAKEFHPNDQIDFKYKWSWNRPSDYQDKTYQFSFTLPENISYTPSGGSIGDPVSFGSYSIQQDGKLTFTFDKNLDKFENLESTDLKISGIVKGNIPNNSSISFENFPNGSIPVKEEKQSSISNNLFPISNTQNGSNTFKNLQSIRSVAYVNRTGNTLYEGSSITSQYNSVSNSNNNSKGPTLTVNPDSIVVTPVYLNIDGSENHADAPLTKGTDYEIDGTTIKLKKQINQTIRIDYNPINIATSEIESGASSYKFQQTIALKSTDNQSLGSSTSGDFLVSYDPLIDNEFKNPFGNTYNWAAKYNYDHKTADELIITATATTNGSKTISNAHRLTENDFILSTVSDTSTDSSGSSKLEKGKDYTITFNQDYTEATIKILKDDLKDDGIYIQYKTILDSYVLDDSIQNITLTTTTSSQGLSDTAVSNRIDKNNRNNLFFTIYQADEPIDYNKKIATWHYDINTNRYNNQNYEITNSLPKGITVANNPNFTLKEISGRGYVINNFPGVKNSDQTNSYSIKDGNTTFNITVSDDKKTINTFGENISKRYKLCYDTSFDSSQTTGTNSDAGKYTFDYNSATAKISESNTSAKTITSSARLEIKQSLKDGFATANSDISNRNITWDTIINPGRASLPNQTLYNEITDGKILEYNVYEVSLDKDGNLIENSKVLVSNNNVSKLSDKKISFTPPDSSNKIYLFRLKTSLDNMVLDSEKTIYNNIYKNSEEKPFISGSFRIPNSGQLINKSGVFNTSDKTVDWTIEFNKSQSKLFNAIITDDPSNNQFVNYDDDNFRVEELKLDDNGNTNAVNKIIDKSEYKVEKANQDSTSNKFKIVFNNPIEKAYRIHYKTSPVFKGDLVNSVELAYNGYRSSDTQTYSSKPATVSAPSSQDMQVIGKNSLSVKIRLTDDNQNPLIGQKFKFRIELVVKDNTSIASEQYTDDNGTILWDYPKEGRYVIKQISTDDGYEIPQEWLKGKEFSIGLPDSTSNNIVFEVRNTKKSSQPDNKTDNHEDDDKGKGQTDTNNTGTTEDPSVTSDSKNNQSSSSSTNESSQSSDSDPSIPQDKESSQSSDSSQSDSSASNSTTQSTATQSSTNKPTSNLPQTGQKHDLTLKYVGIIIVLLSGFILYPALKKRR